MSNFKNIENLSMYAATYNQHPTHWCIQVRLPALARLGVKIEIFYIYAEFNMQIIKKIHQFIFKLLKF